MGLYAGYQVIDYLQKHGLPSGSILGVPCFLYLRPMIFGIALRVSTPNTSTGKKNKTHIHVYIHGKVVQ
jgi:hypothetical protein